MIYYVEVSLEGTPHSLKITTTEFIEERGTLSRSSLRRFSSS